MAGCRILILTALLPEGRTIARSLKLQKLDAPLTVWMHNDIAVAVVGMRCGRLSEVSKIPEIAQPAGMVMAGLAGGLASELHRAAVVVDGKGLPGSVVNTGVRMGRIHTSNTIISTPAEKAKLLAETGCIAVDMETAVARRFAARLGVPFAAMRGISDTVRDTLDPSLLSLIDNEGRVQLGAVLRLLLRKPVQIKSLFQLQRTSRRALANLSEVLRRLVASHWPGTSTKRPPPA